MGAAEWPCLVAQAFLPGQAELHRQECLGRKRYRHQLLSFFVAQAFLPVSPKLHTSSFITLPLFTMATGRPSGVWNSSFGSMPMRVNMVAARSSGP